MTDFGISGVSCVCVSFSDYKVNQKYTSNSTTANQSTKVHRETKPDKSITTYIYLPSLSTNISTFLKSYIWFSLQCPATINP